MRSLRPFVFVLGPPGCGKGTQCALLCNEFSSLHLSAGDLLRQYIRSDTDEARKLNKIMSEGQIVPAEVTVGLLHEQLRRTTAPLCIVDGFPRNLENFSAWNDIVAQQPKFVLNITAQMHDVQHRLLTRAQGRSDDNLETIKKRFKVHESVYPVLDAYHSQGKLRTVDGTSSVQGFADVHSQVRQVFLEELSDVLAKPGTQEPSPVHS